LCTVNSATSRIALIAIVMLAACGGSDDADESASTSAVTIAVSTVPPTTGAIETAPSTTLPTPTTQAPTPSTQPATTVPETTAAVTSVVPTTVPDTRPVDEAAQALALAGTLVATDFPEPWTQYSPGGEFQADPTSCSYRPDGPTTRIPHGGGQFGPTMQFGDTTAYVSSSASVFPAETDASEFIDIIATEEWGTCRAEQLQQAQRDAGFDDITVAVTSRTNDVLGQNGLEGYGEFSFTDADGNLTRVVLISYYRLGRTVISVVQEYGELSDTESTAFFDDAYNALTAAYGRVNAAG
jgi:hypothetical protein